MAKRQLRSAAALSGALAGDNHLLNSSVVTLSPAESVTQLDELGSPSAVLESPDGSPASQPPMCFELSLRAALAATGGARASAAAAVA